ISHERGHRLRARLRLGCRRHGFERAQFVGQRSETCCDFFLQQLKPVQNRGQEVHLRRGRRQWRELKVVSRSCARFARRCFFARRRLFCCRRSSFWHEIPLFFFPPAPPDCSADVRRGFL